MKQLIARILATANILDKSGQYTEADALTKIAQELPSNLNQVGDDIGNMFGLDKNTNYEANSMMNQMEDDMNNKIIAFLSKLVSMNFNDDNGFDKTLLDIDEAHAMYEEAKQLLAEMNEYTGQDMQDNNEGPADGGYSAYKGDYDSTAQPYSEQLGGLEHIPYKQF